MSLTTGSSTLDSPLAGSKDPALGQAPGQGEGKGKKGKKGKKPKMATKLAYRNLFHDKMSLFVTLIGIVFSVVLISVQCGLYLGSEYTIARILDRTGGDIWIVPLGTKSFDDPSLLKGRERYAVHATPGVERVEELAVSFARWRKPQGGKTAILLVGADGRNGGLVPWNIVDGSVAAMRAPAGVSVDKSYFKDLGIDGLGSTAEINGQTVRVETVTRGIRSFTTIPYVFTTLGRAQSMMQASYKQSSYTVATVKEDADVETVRSALVKRLPDAEVLTTAEFRARSLKYWLFQTGAGAALIAGAMLGLIVGVVIVAQTLYASTKDHINEFATLRALGASAGYIVQVILMQAILSAIVGYALGMCLALLIVYAADGTTLNVVMTPGLAAALFLVTLGMCTFAAISAILKVIRIDPASVFSR